MTTAGRLAPGLGAALVVVVGCASAQRPYADAFAEAQPRSIVVMPVIGSPKPHAAEFVLSLLPIPIAERGYYVFPVALALRVLEEEGVGAAADPIDVAAIFGADAVLYVSIMRWDTVYGATTDTVELSYVLRCGKTGEILWSDGEQRTHEWAPNANQGFFDQLLNAIIDPLLTPLLADYEQPAREANDAVLATQGRGLPEGPYRRQQSQPSQQGPSTPAAATATAAD